MKLVKWRKRPDKVILSVSVLLALMPLWGLLTGTAFSLGAYGSNYHEFGLAQEPDRFWFLIKVQGAIWAYVVMLAFVDFPLIKHLYERLIAFKNQHKIISYLTLYLLVPIIVVALFLFCLHVFDIQ